MTEATHTPDNTTNPVSEAPKRRKDTRKGDRHSPGYRTAWMSKSRAKDKEIIRLRAALKPFVDAYKAKSDPGTSDLDNEQPVAWHVPLGAYRLALMLQSVTPE